MILYDFDLAMEAIAGAEGLFYSRYADDITVSSEGYIDSKRVIGHVEKIILDTKSPKLLLNQKKTYLASKSQDPSRYWPYFGKSGLRFARSE